MSNLITGADDDHRAVAAQVNALGDAVASLARRDHSRELLQIMRRPGWTTPEEAQLVGAMVGHLHALVTAAHDAHDALLEAADRIGRS